MVVVININILLLLLLLLTADVGPGKVAVTTNAVARAGTERVDRGTLTAHCARYCRQHAPRLV